MIKPDASAPARRAAIGARPKADPASAWVQAAEASTAVSRVPIYTARLTIDVTPALRARIKMSAFRRGLTAADVLRVLLEQTFPEDGK